MAENKQYQNDPNSTSIHERNAAQTDRNAANNANTINNAADVAMASKHPVAVGIGAGIKAADKLTGGKSTEALGRAMANGNKFAPGGRSAQNASNMLSESGIGDKIGTAASFAGKSKGGSQAAKGAEKGAQSAEKAKKAKEAQEAAQKARQAQQQGNKKGAELANQDALKKHDQVNNQNKNQNKDANGAAAGNGNAASSSGEEGEKSKKKKRLPNGRPDYSSGGEEEDEFSNDQGSKLFAQLSGFIGQLLLPVILSFLPIILSVFAVIIVVGVIMTCINDFSDTFSFKSLFQSEEQEDFDYNEEYMEEFYDSLDDQSKASNLVIDDNKKASAVAHVIVDNGGKGDLSEFSSSEISSFKRAIKSDDETSKQNLARDIFPKYFPNNSYDDNYSLANDVINYINEYGELAANEGALGAAGLFSLGCSSGAGACNYGIKGLSYNGTNVSKNMSISDLKVRLMQTNNWTSEAHFNGTCGQPMANEELVPFEKYILGVGYAEIGCPNNADYFKAMLVAARSFSLTRPDSMNNSCGLKLFQENGNWILQIRMSVADQAYCDPDKGCSHDSNGQWSQLHSGTGSGITYKGPMASSSQCRQWASQVEGQVLVNSQGNVIMANYAQSEQTKMQSLAASGMNYKQILLQIYNNASDIQSNNCGQSATCSSTGDFTGWKQTDSKWASVELDSSGANIGQVGCLATAISIQIKRSGVDTSSVPGEFNPGTFVQAMNQHNGFDSNANLSWTGVTATVPGFKYGGKVSVMGKTKQEKLQTLSGLLSQGYYVVAEVKGNTGQHWVAVESISGDTVKMMDPGSNSTDMWNEYGSDNTSTFSYYKTSR